MRTLRSFATAAIAGAVLLLPSPVYAEEPRTVAVYRQHMQSRDHQAGSVDHTLHHLLYLSGAADAYAVINKHRLAVGNPPLFCLPEGVDLNGSDSMRQLERALGSTQSAFPDEMPVAEALLVTLQQAYPCSR